MLRVNIAEHLWVLQVGLTLVVVESTVTSIYVCYAEDPALISRWDPDFAEHMTEILHQRLQHRSGRAVPTHAARVQLPKPLPEVRQTWTTLENYYQQKIRQEQHQQGERHGNTERPSSNCTEKEPKIPYRKLWETVRSMHKFFSLLQTCLYLKEELSVLLWSLVHDFRMKIVCLHGQRSLQIALFLPPWGFGNCRWFHIFISLLHPAREFQQLLCNLSLNWSLLYCQCSVFLGEVFSMGILWRAPNSLDAIFQTDKFYFCSYALIWRIPGSEVINLLSVGACPETKRKIFLGFFYADEMGFKMRVQWPCFVSAGAFNGICYVFALYCANITSCFLVDWVRIMGFGPASYKDFVSHCLLVNRVKSMLFSLTHLESFSEWFNLVLVVLIVSMNFSEFSGEKTGFSL